jgi:hypothetical protein
VRFSLLCASAALAASLVLSGCSTNGSSSAIPGGSSVAAPSGHGIHNLHMVMAGVQHAYTCSGSGLYACYLVNNGKTDFEWCIVDVTSGNCTSNLAPGKWKWSNTAPIAGKPQTQDLSTGMPTGKVKSTWCHTVGSVTCHSGSVANPAENEINVKASVKYTNGKPGYEFGWEACAKSGPYKGSCVTPPGEIGIIVGNY